MLHIHLFNLIFMQSEVVGFFAFVCVCVQYGKLQTAFYCFLWKQQSCYLENCIALKKHSCHMILKNMWLCYGSANNDYLQTFSVPKESFADLEHCLDFISKLVWELFNFHPFITVIQVTQSFLF